MGHHTVSTSHPPLRLPTMTEGSGAALHLESTLQDLALHHFAVALDRRGADLANVFERYPLLPGATLTDHGKFVGLLSRQQLLEFLIRPHGMSIFLQEPLWVLRSYARAEMLLLSGDTPILVAAQQALRRSPDLRGEPIVVQQHDQHYLLDVHELNIAYWQLRGIETQVRYERMQAQMIQSDKMASLGRLVDGVAHEILDPISFIWGNLSHITNYTQELLDLIAAYEHALPQPPAEVQTLRDTVELDYLQHDLPRAVQSVKAGAERLSKLATSLQNFCHIDEVYPKPINLHEVLDGILLLLKSRLSSEIQVVRNYGTLPPVQCYPGHLNQVLMNILSNCLDSLLNQAVSLQLDWEFKNRRQPPPAIAPAFKPTIEITTQVCSMPTDAAELRRWVSICIADNGPGLSPEAQRQLLESFSVERRTEKETSLAVSYQIITAKHGGKFQVRSRSAHLPFPRPPAPPESSFGGEAPWGMRSPTNLPDQTTGTEFEILLPLT